MKFNYQDSAMEALNNLFNEIAEKFEIMAGQTGQEEQEPKEITLNLSSWDLVKDIKIGWNLGNNLDSCFALKERNTHTPEYQETCWGNIVATNDLFVKIKKLGFNAVRVAVTWQYQTNNDSELIVNDAWMNRVQEVVDYVINNGMYCILNTHSDRQIIKADYTKIDYYSNQMCKLWEQIAKRFKDYGDHLIFEAYNEVLDENENWTGDTNSIEATNKLAQAFTNFIRTTGGNNYSRNIMVNTYAAGMSELIVNGFEVPKDSVENRLIVSVHDYEMYAGSELKKSLDRVYNKFKDKAPVIIGEFGAQVTELSAKNRYANAQNIVAFSYERGFKCFIWDSGYTDDQKTTGVTKRWGVIERTTGEPIFPELMKSLLNGSEGITVEDNKKNVTEYNDSSFICCGFYNKDSKDFVEKQNGSNILLKIPMEVTEGYDYKFTALSSDTGFRIPYFAFIDKEGNIIGTIAKTNPTLEFINTTAPSGAKKIIIQIYNPWNSGVTLDNYKQLISSGELRFKLEETEKDIVKYITLGEADLQNADLLEIGKFNLSDATVLESNDCIKPKTLLKCNGESMYNVGIPDGYKIDIIMVSNEEMVLGHEFGLTNGSNFLTLPSTSFLAVNISGANSGLTGRDLYQLIQNGEICTNSLFIEKNKNVGDMKQITLAKSTAFEMCKCLNLTTGEIKDLGRTDYNYCALKTPLDVSDRGNNYIAITSKYGEKRLLELNENKKVIKADTTYQTIKKFYLKEETKYITFESTYVIDGDPVIISYFEKANQPIEVDNPVEDEESNIGRKENDTMITIIGNEINPTITDTFTITNSTTTISNNVSYVDNMLEVDNASGTGKSVTFLQMKQFVPKGKTAYEITATLKDNIPSSKNGEGVFNSRIGFDNGSIGVYATLSPVYGLRLLKGTSTAPSEKICDVNDCEECKVKLALDFDNLQNGGKLYFNDALVKEIGQEELTSNSISNKNCPNITVTDANLKIKEIKFSTGN